MKSNISLRIFISLLAAILAVIHVWKPEVQVDSITIILLVLCALPWMQPLIKTVELLGVKIELQELKKQIDEAKGAAASASRQASFAVSAVEPSSGGFPSADMELSAGEAAIEELAKNYEHIRATQRSGNVRTAEMTSIVRDMMELARRLKMLDVYKFLEVGSAGKRLYAYAYIYIWPGQDYLGILVSTITSREDTAFGQYWGLQALSHVVTTASNIQLEVKERLRMFWNRLPRGTDREYELNKILKMIE